MTLTDLQVASERISRRVARKTFDYCEQVSTLALHVDVYVQELARAAAYRAAGDVTCGLIAVSYAAADRKAQLIAGRLPR